jgi:membrane fusion protein, multidrug efflux system
MNPGQVVRRTISAGLAATGLLWAAGGCSSRSSDPAAENAAAALMVRSEDVIAVRSEPLEAGIPFTGELAPRTTTRVMARFDGDIDRVLVREGDRVRRGASLAVFAPRDLTDLLAAAEAELKAAEAALLAAKSQEERTRRLLAAGAAAPMDLEAATAARSAAEARQEGAEAARNHAQENAERLSVPSPVTGRVSEVAVHDGDRTASGDPLFTLVDTDTLELSATLPSEALGLLRVGGPIRFRLEAYPDREWTARIDRLSPVTEPGTRQVRLFTRVPNRDGRLVGGLFASGVVITESRSAPSAPVGVVRKEGGESVVYVLRNGRAVRTPVQHGLLDEARGLVELRGSVSPGDSVLSGVLPGIRDGSPIRILTGS